MNLIYSNGGPIKPYGPYLIKAPNNKMMRKFIEVLVVTLLVGMNQLAFAQQEKTLLKTEQISAKLGLDETQKAQLDKELKSSQQERKARMEKYRAIREEMKRDAFVENQAQRERLKEILTDEQIEKLKALNVERGGREFRGRQGARNGQRLDRQRAEQFRQERRPMMRRRMGEFRQERRTDRKEEGGN